MRRVIQFCFPLGFQPSAYRSYKGFTDVIMPLKFFPGAAASVGIRDLNPLSELQAGLWEENYGGAVFVHVSLDAALWAKGNFLVVFFGKCCMSSPTALRKEVWVSLQGGKMMLSEPKALGDECKT